MPAAALYLVGFFEDGGPFLEIFCDLGDGLWAGDFFGAEVDDGLEEAGAADGEADEAGDFGGGGEPLDDFLFVFSAAEDDAADAVASVAAGGVDDGLAVLLAVETFDFPDVGFDAGVLEGFDGADHEGGAEFEVVAIFVVVDGCELRFFGGDEEFEHEEALGFGEVVGELLEARGLAGVHDGVGFGVVADEDFDEGGLEAFDVGGVIVAELEVEFVLAALFHGHGDDVFVGAGIIEDGVAEFFIDEKAGVFFGDSGGECGFEAVVDDGFAVGDVLDLGGGHGFLVAEDFGTVGVAVVEGEDVEGVGVAGGHGGLL